MKKRMLKILALVAVAAMVGGLFGGCTSASPTAAPTTAPATVSAAATDAPAPTPAEPEKVTITSFGATDPDIDQLCGGDFNKTPAAMAKEKITGIHVDYILASPDNAAEQFKLLLSSGDIPDVFGGVLDADYPGGKSKALADGVITAINPYLDTICLDYKKALESNPEYMKNVQDDKGTIYGFAKLLSNSSRVYGGPMIRKDLLEKAGIAKLPVTIDDWHTALTAIKAAGYTSPLTIQFNWKIDEGGFCGAYGATGTFALGLDGKVHLGAIEDGYRQFLDTFAKWYAEGLIDPDFFTVSDPSLVNAKMTDMKTSGACLANVSRVKITNTAGRQVDPNFNVVGCQYPVLKEGDKVLYGQQDPPVDQRWYVSGKAKNVEACMRFYNFEFTDAGITLDNWGIEGLTYTVKDGKNQFTDEIPILADKNAKGLTYDQAIKMYLPMAADTCGVEVGDSFMAIRMTYPNQPEAIKAWSDFQLSYALPPSLFYTDAELAVMKKKTDIDEAIKSWRMKFVMGNEPLTKWDDFVAEIKKLGADEVLSVMNDANDRYNNRK